LSSVVEKCHTRVTIVATRQGDAAARKAFGDPGSG
jgi:hypothetical protein